jgi:hypothetical protein
MNPFILCITDGWLTAISTTALAILTLIIAIYAKGTFEESRKSFKHSVGEITKDRIIGIIYNQLERIESAIEKFEVIDDKGKTLIGYEALLFFRNNFSRFYPITYDGKTPEEVIDARKRINKHNLDLLYPNDNQVNILSIRFYNAIGIVKETLLHRELEIDEINRLKKLLFDNIGFITMKTIKEIIETVTEYFKLIEEDENYQVDWGHLNLASVFFKSIVKFEEVIFTAGNFESEKKELLK